MREIEVKSDDIRQRLTIAIGDQKVRVTMAEGEEIVSQLLGYMTHYPDIVRVTWLARTAPHGAIHVKHEHKNGEIIEHFQLVVYSGTREMMRGPQNRDRTKAIAEGTRIYGRSIEIDPIVQYDKVSVNLAEKQQLLFLGKQYAASQGMTLKELLTSIRKGA